MKLRDLIGLSIKNIGRGGIKSFLCAMAVCVGVCSVCVVSGLGETVNGAVKSQVDQMGIGGIIIYSDTPVAGGITQEDAETLIRAVSGIEAAMPLSMKLGSATLRNQLRQAALCGIDQSLCFECNSSCDLCESGFSRNFSYIAVMEGFS